MIVSAWMSVIMGMAAGNISVPVFGAAVGQPEQVEDNMEPGDSEETEEEITEEAEEEVDEQEDEQEDEIEKVKLAKPVLCAASNPDGKIKITWKKVDGAAEYVLFRSTEKDSGFRKIYRTRTERSYIDEKRSNGKSYYYRMTVLSKGRTGRAKSKTVAGRSLNKVELSEISNLSGSRKLVLHWNPVKGAAGYQIQRKNTAGQYKIIANVKGTKNSFTDKERNGGKTYTYRVCAIDAHGGRGNYSEPLAKMAIDNNQKMIALTYDDGPSEYTPIVLDALEKYGAHATFFVVGNRVNQYGDSLRREKLLGCEIGNHTYAHNNLKNLGVMQILSVISETNQAVKMQNGVDIHIMRPPGGGYNATVCNAVGMPIILWSVDTLDWRTRNTAATIQCVKEKANDGAIVLMHDLHQPTANAADAVIGYLQQAGYQMVTVSEMAAYRGGMIPGKVYSQFKK